MDYLPGAAIGRRGVCVDEATALHSALVSAFEAVLLRFDPASTFEQRPTHVVLTCPRLPLPQMNGVWLERGDAPALAELERIRDAIESLGVPFSLQARASLASDVAEVADRLGLRLADRAPGMVLLPNELAAGGAPQLDIERISDAAGLRIALDVAAAGFDAPPELMQPMYTQEVLETPGVTLYVGRSGPQTVCTAVSYLAGDKVGIFNVATPEPSRRRGFGSAITRHACMRGFAEGAELAWLQSTPAGEPVYHRLGFRQVETYLVYERAAVPPE